MCICKMCKRMRLKRGIMRNESVIKLKERSRTSMDDYVCELTKFIDEFVIDRIKPELDKHLSTYLSQTDIPNTMGIMFPGATRGYIEFTPDGKIKHVSLYKEPCFGRKIGVYEKELTAKLLFDTFKDCTFEIPEKKMMYKQVSVINQSLLNY